MTLQDLDTLLTKTAAAGLSLQGLHILANLALNTHPQPGCLSHRTLADLIATSIPDILIALHYLQDVGYVTLTRSHIMEMTFWVEITSIGRHFIQSLHLDS